MHYINKTASSIGIVLIMILFLLGSACKRSGSTDANSKTHSQNGSVITQTDSTFIDSYLKKERGFADEDTLIRKFYAEREYRLAWFNGEELIPQADKFIEVINSAHREGLNPADYKFKDFGQMYEAYSNTSKDDPGRIEKKAELDIALTGTYFIYSRDFYKGTVDPRKVDNIQWKVKKNKFKPIKALQTILKERESRYPYYQFAPLHEDYDKLRKALSQLRDIQRKGGWPVIPEVKILKKGDSSEIVPVLRKRLQDYMPAEAKNQANTHLFDDALDQAVKRFQVIHGLKADGAVGGNTLKTLNVSVDERINQVILNMERWRWVPKRLPEQHIFVNIPEYHLYVVENGKRVLDMKVIVGKTMNSTPVFSDKLEYIVFSPFWNITENILFDEVIPAQIRNPNFMASQDMEVVKDLGKNKVEIIPIHSIDWGSVVREDFKYRVRQRPGDKNPLGHVKFIFPNSYDVYLHDTPNDYLFSQAERGFSHGCIRMEKPVEMAKYLLRNKEGWNEKRIKNAMNTGQEEYVNLPEKVPVYIVYFTTWVDDQGIIHFRDDIYGHDKKLAEAYF